MLLENSFNGGTNGVAISAGNSGGASGDPLTSVSSWTYSNENATGQRAPLVAKTGTSFDQAVWRDFVISAKTLYVRDVIRLPNNPTYDAPIVRIALFGGIVGSAAVNTNRTMSIWDSTDAVVATTTTVVPLNQWVRVEFMVTAGSTTSNGAAELRLYLDADSMTLTESKTATGNFNTSKPDNVTFGSMGTAYYVDDIAISDEGWIGPGAPPPQNVTLTGISSGQTFGSTKANFSTLLTGIPSGETVGSLALSLCVQPEGITSQEAFGSIEIHQNVSYAGIPSNESFGDIALNLGISLDGMPSGEAFGISVVGGSSIGINGIPSEETFGSTTLVPVQIVSLAGVPSDETFGDSRLSIPFVLALEGIPSEETFGNTHKYAGIPLRGIPSQEKFGTLQVKGYRFILRPRTIQETPMARNILHIRYGIHRGISILKRHDGTYYQTRFPAQTEIEECEAYYLGGHEYTVSQEVAQELINAGFNDCLTLELAE